MSKKVKSQRKLRTNQIKAIEALVEGQSKQNAAIAAGVTPKTVSTWLRKDFLFIETLDDQKRHILATASVQLLGSVSLACETLRELVKNGANDALKLRAAHTLLTHAIKLHEIADLDVRLRMLEDAILAGKGEHEPV